MNTGPLEWLVTVTESVAVSPTTTSPNSSCAGCATSLLTAFACSGIASVLLALS
jgi:hypothetical protein